MNNTRRKITNEYCRFEINPDFQKTFIHNKSNPEIFLLNTIQEFTFQIESENYSGMLLADECDIEFADTTSEIKTIYHHRIMDIVVSYKICDNIIIKNIKVNANEVLFIRYAQSEVCDTNSQLSRGGEGQPIFIDGIAFASMVFPAAQNIIDHNTIILEQSPFFNLEKGDQYELYPVVFGFSNEKTPELGFMKYIENCKIQTSQGIKIYCDWGAHDELAVSDSIDLNEEMAVNLLDNLDRVKKSHGIKFDYYLMDAFWFQEDKPYTDFKQASWPNGVQSFVKSLNNSNIKYGLWFDVNMAMVQMKETLKHRSDSCKELCMADDENIAILFTAIEKQIVECGIKMLKFDFAYFECDNKEHGFHSTGGIKSKEVSIRKFIQGLERLRKIEPDLIVLAYNGFTTKLDYLASIDKNKNGYVASPFWCLYVDYIYCGDPRPSEIPCSSLDSSIIYYTDSMIEQFNKALIPYNAIDDHGTIVGNTSTIYFLGNKILRDSWMMNISRGNRKLNLYGDLNLLDDDDWKFIKQSYLLFNFVCGKDNNTIKILGNAFSEEPYGYSNSKGNRGYITCVNCDRNSRNINIKLNEWETCQDFCIKRIYKKGDFVDGEQNFGNESFNISLLPDEIAVYEWSFVASNLQKVYVKVDPQTTEILKINNTTLRFAISFSDEKFSPVRSSNNGYDKFILTCETAEFRRNHTQQIWSGISWYIYENANETGKSESNVLKFTNNGDHRIYLKYQALTERGGR